MISARSSSSMRIVHVIDGIGVGGAEFVLLYLVRGMQAAGHHNTIISLATPRHLVAELEATGAVVQSLNFAKGRLPTLGALQLGSAIRSARPDLIQGWMYHGNAAAGVGRMLALELCPLVWSIHNTLEPVPDYRWFTRLAMRAGALCSSLADAIVYVSAASAQQHERQGYRAARTVVIPNGIDIARFRPNEEERSRLRAKLGINPHTPLLGCFARWDPMKGHERLLHALRHLPDSSLAPHLVLAGSAVDHENTSLLGMIRTAGLDGRVHLLGTRRDIPELLTGLDLFVLPSIWGEAFPLALGEAMAAGVPSVATDIGDCRLLLGDGGLLVPPGDEAALASAIDRILSLSRAERQDMGARARARVTERFSLPALIERYGGLYAKLAHQHRGEPQWTT